MRVLVFGAQGMLGTMLVHAHGEHRMIDSRADITSEDEIERAVNVSEPDVIVNCAGIVKSECVSVGRERVWAVNAIAPHTISRVAARHQARFIHISTDCVFNGERGGYREDDPPDAGDLYGDSKTVGEIVNLANVLTLRTSFIGWDLRHRRGLLEWLIAQRDVVQGYANARWSGVSAAELARVIVRVLGKEDLQGLYHVAGPVISKADLLEALIKRLRWSLRVERVEEPRLDRTLDGSKFRAATGYMAPSWEDMPL